MIETGENRIDLLLIEDNIHDAQLFSEYLSSNYTDEFTITHSPNIKSGIEYINKSSFDIIIADLNLPDSTGLNTFAEVKKAAGNVPVIILSGINDNSLTIESVKGGAQDFIYKGDYRGDFIYRVIHHAIEREKLLREIEEKSEKLSALNKTLSEINYNKDKIYSIISHDLLNPLNALLGYSEILKDNYENFSEQERKEIISVIHELTSRSSSLLKDLLLWSAVNSGHITSNPEKLNIALLLQEQIEFLKFNANKKNIKIVSDINEMYVYADKIMIETIIRNLISNAVKFTNESGIISVTNYTEGNNIVVSIEDTGIGMDEDQIRKLFKAEESISKKDAGSEKGLGLGLLICREFIAKNKGKIEVSSKKDIGTTFRFFLPAV